MYVYAHFSCMLNFLFDFRRQQITATMMIMNNRVTTVTTDVTETIITLPTPRDEVSDSNSADRYRSIDAHARKSYNQSDHLRRRSPYHVAWLNYNNNM
jgi:hypothetical protein